MIEQNDNSILEKRHSRLGVTSLVIGIAVPFLLILIFAVAMFIGVKKDSIGSGVLFADLIFAVSAPAFHLLGIILGVIGWVSKKTKNLFPIIGTVLNSILFILGFLIGGFIAYQIINVGGLILH